ncbi:hypothetical protein XENTR_v10016709 [Xenopus tropicalis]|nr:hypothetical protein XENTR_v10016709 [Xenopus tropicalis]
MLFIQKNWAFFGYRTLNDNTTSQLTAVSQSCCFLHFQNCKSSFCCSFLVAVRQYRRIGRNTEKDGNFFFWLVIRMLFRKREGFAHLLDNNKKVAWI